MKARKTRPRASICPKSIPGSCVRFLVGNVVGLSANLNSEATGQVPQLVARDRVSRVYMVVHLNTPKS